MLPEGWPLSSRPIRAINPSQANGRRFRAVIAMENARLMLTLPTGWLIQVNSIAREKSNQATLVQV